MYKPSDFTVGGKYDFDLKLPWYNKFNIFCIFDKPEHYYGAIVTKKGKDYITVGSDLGSRMSELRFGTKVVDGKPVVVAKAPGFPKTLKLKRIANLRPSEIEDPPAVYIEFKVTKLKIREIPSTG
jgi:hypothetical protein